MRDAFLLNRFSGFHQAYAAIFSSILAIFSPFGRYRLEEFDFGSKLNDETQAIRLLTYIALS
jgi:hypothetical protein